MSGQSEEDSGREFLDAHAALLLPKITQVCSRLAPSSQTSFTGLPLARSPSATLCDRSRHRVRITGAQGGDITRATRAFRSSGPREKLERCSLAILLDEVREFGLS